jgi:hypothetical protein
MGCRPVAVVIMHVQWTLESRIQSVPRGGSTFNLFDFRVKWHKPNDAVQCHAHGSTFEFLFHFQTEFFSNFFVRVSSCSKIKPFDFRGSTVHEYEIRILEI